MKRTLALLALLLVGCTAKDNTAEIAVTPQTVIADGSSTVFPIMREAAQRFMAAGGQDVSVKFSGTTAGFRSFCTDEIDIANASRPMNAEEEALCQQNGVAYRRLALAGDAIAIVTHKRNRQLDSLSTEELRRLWQEGSDVNTWADLRPGLAAQHIALYGRGQDSGTYDYFTEAITGQVRSSRSDYQASEDEEFLADKIANDPNSLGFFGLGAYHRHWDELKLLAIDAGRGPVYPSLETARSGAYTPLSRPLYLYVKQASLSNKAGVREFLEQTYQELPRWLHFTGYLPLGASEYDTARRELAQR